MVTGRSAPTIVEWIHYLQELSLMMRIAYLDCASGISGDMTLGALVDAGVDLSVIQQGIDSLRLPSCRLVASEVKKKGFRATQIVIEHEPEHAHRHLSDIRKMIEGSSITDRQEALAIDIFTKLGEAEARAHGTSIEKVHFHEVGAVDSIADIVGSAIGWDLLGVDQIVCSPIPTGTGFIHIAHGRCSIPAPATADLLRDIPLAEFPEGKEVKGELTTPTGAAIVKTLANKFGPLPAMKIEKIGYGAGQKDFDHANLLRLFVGESVSKTDDQDSPPTTIMLLETNLDDTSGEQLGDCLEQLWQAGVLDASVQPIQMKKQRPGILLSVQTRVEQADEIANLIFRHTTALGLRRQLVERIVLPRHKVKVTTPWGEVSGIVATLPDGSERFSSEYEDCKALAVQSGVTFAEVTLAAHTEFSRER